MWIGGGSEAAIKRTAHFGTGWLGGPETPAEARRVVAAIRQATAAAGRSIDADHYGAGFPFYIGRAGHPALQSAMDAYQKRTKRDPGTYFAVGDPAAILERIGEYIEAGVSKFVLRPVGSGEELLAQTRLLIEQVLPEVAGRWPRNGHAG
jgi:alkanesulfonate monooxygenase SsuD/methylene tetrahydromethanopterin reductase-like flavin-dependent oxidoreductase (luciferase family)